MYTESAGSATKPFTQPYTGGTATRENSQAARQNATLGADTVSIRNPYPGQSRAVIEFSVQASIQRTFESSFNYSGGGREVSAYTKSSETAEFKLNMKMTQADALAKAQANAMQSPFGPEAVAQRIADFALGLFPMFAADNPDMSEEEQITAFKAMVEGAIDEGFSEAMAILGTLPGDVMDQVNETRSLVQDKLDSFFAYLRSDGSEEGKSAVENGVWGDFVNEFFEGEKEEATA